MGYFSETAAAALAGRTVQCVNLVYLDFASSPMWLWEGGIGDLFAGGATWKGLGQLGQIGEIENPIGSIAPNVTLSLSGVDPALIAEVAGTPSDYRYRTVGIFKQFFTTNWTALDSPYLIFSGIMDLMKFSLNGPTSATVSLTCEVAFARGGAARYGYYTARDQQIRYPGDNGLNEIPQMRYRTSGWPWL